MCNCGLDQEKIKQLEEVIAKHKGQEGSLIPVLHEAQEIFGYLPEQVQKIIADGLGVSLAEVYGVATFYARFSLEPKGKYNIQVCMGTACYVKGADKVLEKLQEVLGVEPGKCTEDGLFSIEATRCVGACGLAPVMVVNEEVYGKATPAMVEEVIAKYRELG